MTKHCQSCTCFAPEPAADVAALNRELCDKEGHVLGVIARPCLRCHAWFDPQYGKNMNLADSRDLSLFALTVLTNLTGATPATHPDTFKVAQQYADAWRSRQPETKAAVRQRWESTGLCGCTGELTNGERPFACEHGFKTELQQPQNGGAGK